MPLRWRPSVLPSAIRSASSECSLVAANQVRLELALQPGASRLPGAAYGDGRQPHDPGDFVVPQTAEEPVFDDTCASLVELREPIESLVERENPVVGHDPRRG